ncbi:MAG: alternative ribosome rescue aminoacyl-tRNA hydrolase ArfB [Bacteroidia bacterium]
MNWSDLLGECTYQTARSGGPGGQHVNKVKSQVVLRFDVRASQVLTPEAQEQVPVRLATRINKAGELILRARADRSQAANKAAVQERFVQLIEAALTPVSERKPTRIPRAVREARRRDKKLQSEKKQRRKLPNE